MKEKVIVGLSGGVDSAVTAKLLIDQGYEVIGASLLMCAYNESAKRDAERVAQSLGIEFHIIDARERFDREIMRYFADEYMNGRTPNPCIRCNELVKWTELLGLARRLGAHYIATGHYARIKTHPNGRLSIVNSASATKDQTYVLYRLSQDMLSHTLIPLGDYDKDIVRSIAQSAKLPVASKKDSQDICFIPDGDYSSFLKGYLGEEALPGEGDFVSEDGTVLGRHRGYTNYTIGQRRGLEIAAGHRVFVKRIRPENNEVIISDEDVYSTSLVAEDIFYMSKAPEDLDLNIPNRGFAKLRYAHKGEWCSFEIVSDDSNDKKTLRVTFDRPVRAVTPGQAVVIYDSAENDRSVILGATISAG